MTNAEEREIPHDTKYTIIRLICTDLRGTNVDTDKAVNEEVTVNSKVIRYGVL